MGALDRSMIVRSGIGLCLIAGISGLAYVDHVTGHAWGAIGISLVLMGLGLREYGAMATTVAPVARRTIVIVGLAYLLLKGLAHEVDPRLAQLQAPALIAGAYAIFFACLMGAPSAERFHGMTASLFGLIYLALLGGFALEARFLPDVGEAAFFFIVFIAKGTDIFAYFTGRFLGRTKVVPSVSPGKTVAGFVGAVVGGVIITGLFCALTPLGKAIPLALVPGVGIVLALIVISGDLIESFIKRSVEVKDSSNMLPHFGGVLDIIDSIVIVAPAVYFTLVLCRALVPA